MAAESYALYGLLLGPFSLLSALQWQGVWGGPRKRDQIFDGLKDDAKKNMLHNVEPYNLTTKKNDGEHENCQSAGK